MNEARARIAEAGERPTRRMRWVVGFVSAVILQLSAFDMLEENLAGALGMRTAMANSGECLPTEISDQSLRLQGSGLRRARVFFNVYCASLYLQKSTSDSQAILDDSKSRKLIVMRYKRDVTADEAKKYLLTALEGACDADKDNCPSQDVKDEYLDAAAVDVLEGDVTAIEFGEDDLGQYGLWIRLPKDINGRGKRIANAGLARIVLGIFIGLKPIDEDLRKCLLGIRCPK